MKQSHIVLPPRSKSYAYKRKVSPPLSDVLGKKQLFLSLKTRDLNTANARAKSLSQQFLENTKRAAEGRPILPWVIPETPRKALRRSEAALARAQEFFPQADADALREMPELAYEAFYDAMAEVGDQAAIDALALARGETVEDTWTLSQVVEEYLSISKGDIEKHTRYALNAWLEFVSDKPMDSLRRSDVSLFVDGLASKGNKTGTIKRRLTSLKAAINTVNTHLELSLRNPFTNYKIQGLGEDVKERPSIPEEDRAALVNTLYSCKADDQVGLLIGTLYHTGMRLAEAAGLLREDVFLDAEIPHLVIKPHTHRRLKTKSSSRVVPLVGVSKWAVERRMKNSKSRHFLFPRYANKESTNTEGASAIVKKRLVSWGYQGYTAHNLRHTFVTMLREQGCDFTIAQLLLGHRLHGVQDTYGDKALLKKKHEELVRIL